MFLTFTVPIHNEYITIDNKKMNYFMMTPEEQKYAITKIIHETFKSRLFKKYFIFNLVFHYELTKSGHIHVHMVYPKITDNDLDMLTLKRLYKRHAHTKNNHACKIEECKDVEQCIRYINKENVFKPV